MIFACNVLYMYFVGYFTVLLIFVNLVNIFLLKTVVKEFHSQMDIAKNF